MGKVSNFGVGKTVISSPIPVMDDQVPMFQKWCQEATKQDNINIA